MDWVGSRVWIAVRTAEDCDMDYARRSMKPATPRNGYMLKKSFIQHRTYHQIHRIDTSPETFNWRYNIIYSGQHAQLTSEI